MIVLRVIAHLAAFPISYLAAWLLSYYLLMFSQGEVGSFRQCFDWFEMAWTAGGLEMVSFVRVFSIILFLPVIVFSSYVVHKLFRK